jgi:hypothetical protein
MDVRFNQGLRPKLSNGKIESAERTREILDGCYRLLERREVEVEAVERGGGRGVEKVLMLSVRVLRKGDAGYTTTGNAENLRKERRKEGAVQQAGRAA